MRGRNPDPVRKRMLGVVHMAVKQLGMADDDYREVLRRVTGRASSADCSLAELHRLISEFERLGYQGKGRPVASPASHPIARKARALWLGLHALGAVRDSSEKALESFAKRQLRIDRLHWADRSQSGALVEALKSWAEREGWKQAASSRLTSEQVGRLLTERLYLRLVELLGAAGGETDFAAPAMLDTRTLYGAVQELGAMLRDARAGAE